MPYLPNIPQPTDNLSDSQGQILGNFQQIQTTFSIDHIPLTTASQNGFHKTLHIVPFSTTTSNPPNNQPVSAPSTVATVGEIFTAQINDGINVDEALYYKTGGGRLMQLTRNFAPVTSTNGYTFLPGGLILQWGRLSVNGSGTLTFATSNIAFPNNCFNVSITPVSKAGGSTQEHVIAPIDGTVSSTGFDYNYNGTTSYVAIYWMAIGN